MILVYDTETTGFPQRGQPLDHPSQPHLVQFAAIMCTDAGKELACVNLVVKPEGYEIPKAASDIHGITTELANEIGVPLRVVVACFTNLRARVQAIAAHNHDFDELIMRVALLRCGGTAAHPGPDRKICTVKESADIVKLPPTTAMKRAGMGDKFKAPNLQELHEYLFGSRFEGAHDALIDVRACLRCLIELRKVYGVCL